MSGSDRIAKIVFWVSLVLTGLLGAMVYGVVAVWKNWPPAPTLRIAWDAFTAEEPGDNLFVDLRQHHMQPNRGQGEGVVTNLTNDDALVFMVGFFDGESQARLVERDGSIRQTWSLDYFDHFPDREQRVCDVESPLRVDTHGAILTERGEVVFNYEYCGTVKLDQCGSVLWTIADDTHHSLTRAEAGGYWSLGRLIWSTEDNHDRFTPFSSTGEFPEVIREDTILRISEDGEILDEFSIPLQMRDGGLLPMMTATGDNFTGADGGREELVHANKVAELPERLADAFPLFDAGDLAISLRELNMVLVLDGETRAVKWHQIGPWLRQHDPEFRSDGRISIFNNNVFRNAYVAAQTDLESPFATNIILIDPVTRETEVRFGERPGEEMLSVIRGQHELLPNDGMVIIEFDAGRVIEVDRTGEIVWEFVNEVDEDHVGEIRNANVLQRRYFEGDVPSETTCR